MLYLTVLLLLKYILLKQKVSKIKAHGVKLFSATKVGRRGKEKPQSEERNQFFKHYIIHTNLIRNLLNNNALKTLLGIIASINIHKKWTSWKIILQK